MLPVTRDVCTMMTRRRLTTSLAEALRPHEITPLFRTEKGEQLVVLMKGIIRPRPSNAWVNVILFVLTLLSVLLAGTLYAYNGPVSSDTGQMILNILTHLGQGAILHDQPAGDLIKPRIWPLPDGALPQNGCYSAVFYPLPLQPLWDDGGCDRPKRTAQE